MDPTNISDEGEVPSSEVGYEGQRPEETNKISEHPPPKSNLLESMEMLLSRLLATSQPPATNSNATLRLIRFDPDDADANIEDWCKVTEIIITSRKLEGADLLLALTHALRGRAATCLIKLQSSQLSWPHVKELLIAKFAKPMLGQDYFDEILRFQILPKETASEAAVRLWNLIERIPRTEMAEDIMTGFATSVLCQKDSLIRRELHSHTVVTRAQLLRILNGISHKRRHESGEGHEVDTKRTRYSDIRFSGTCHRCGTPGHKSIDCRKKQDDPSMRAKPQSQPAKTADKTRITCYVCGQQGHIASTCPDRKGSSGAPTVKDVHICERKSTRSTLHTASDLINKCKCQRRIQDGVEVTQPKPYVVYLIRIDEESPVVYDEWICGGAIVSEFYVVTSAACLEDTKFVYVVAGYDKYVKDEEIETDACVKDMKKKVIYTCIPQKYDFDYRFVERWSHIDIALAKVDDPFNFNDNTYLSKCSYIPQPIKINYENDYQQPNRDAMVLGWGHTKIFRDPTNTQLLNTQKLNYAPVLLADKELCKQPYSVIANMSSIIDMYMICTIEKGNIDDGGEPISTSMPIERGCSTAGGAGPFGNNNTECLGQNDGEFILENSRRETNETINQKSTRSSVFKSRNLRRFGICQNDHGGPLVSWVGSHEILIGVASVFLVGTDNSCQGPYLYTSTQCNGAFLNCMLTKHNEKGFRRFDFCGIPPSNRTYDVKETHISWANFHNGTSNKKKLNENSDKNKNATITNTKPNLKAVDIVTPKQLITVTTAKTDNIKLDNKTTPLDNMHNKMTVDNQNKTTTLPIKTKILTNSNVKRKR